MNESYLQSRGFFKEVLLNEEPEATEKCVNHEEGSRQWHEALAKIKAGPELFG